MSSSGGQGAGRAGRHRREAKQHNGTAGAAAGERPGKPASSAKQKEEKVFEDKISQVVQLTGKTKDEVVIALYDCDNDPNRAVNMLLEGDDQGQWVEQTKKKKPQKPAASEARSSEREEARGGGVEEAAAARGGDWARSGDRSQPPRLRRGGAQDRSWKSRESWENEKNASSRDGGATRGGRGGRRGGRGGGTRGGPPRARAADSWAASAADDWGAALATKPSDDWGTATFPAADDWDNEWGGSLSDTKVFTASPAPEEPAAGAATTATAASAAASAPLGPSLELGALVQPSDATAAGSGAPTYSQLAAAPPAGPLSYSSAITRSLQPAAPPAPAPQPQPPAPSAAASQRPAGAPAAFSVQRAGAAEFAAPPAAGEAAPAAQEPPVGAAAAFSSDPSASSSGYSSQLSASNSDFSAQQPGGGGFASQQAASGAASAPQQPASTYAAQQGLSSAPASFPSGYTNPPGLMYSSSFGSSAPSPSLSQPLAGRAGRPQKTRAPPPARIPDMAVEMPDDVSTLDVKFGGLDFGTAAAPAADEPASFTATAAPAAADGDGAAFPAHARSPALGPLVSAAQPVKTSMESSPTSYTGGSAPGGGGAPGPQSAAVSSAGGAAGLGGGGGGGAGLVRVQSVGAGEQQQLPGRRGTIGPRGLQQRRPAAREAGSREQNQPVRPVLERGRQRRQRRGRHRLVTVIRAVIGGGAGRTGRQRRRRRWTVDQRSERGARRVPDHHAARRRAVCASWRADAVLRGPDARCAVLSGRAGRAAHLQLREHAPRPAAASAAHAVGRAGPGGGVLISRLQRRLLAGGRQVRPARQLVSGAVGTQPAAQVTSAAAAAPAASPATPPATAAATATTTAATATAAATVLQPGCNPAQLHVLPVHASVRHIHADAAGHGGPRLQRRRTVPEAGRLRWRQRLRRRLRRARLGRRLQGGRLRGLVAAQGGRRGRRPGRRLRQGAAGRQVRQQGVPHGHAAAVPAGRPGPERRVRPAPVPTAAASSDALAAGARRAPGVAAGRPGARLPAQAGRQAQLRLLARQLAGGVTTTGTTLRLRRDAHARPQSTEAGLRGRDGPRSLYHPAVARGAGRAGGGGGGSPRLPPPRRPGGRAPARCTAIFALVFCENLLVLGVRF